MEERTRSRYRGELDVRWGELDVRWAGGLGWAPRQKLTARIDFLLPGRRQAVGCEPRDGLGGSRGGRRPL